MPTNKPTNKKELDDHLDALVDWAEGVRKSVKSTDDYKALKKDSVVPEAQSQIWEAYKAAAPAEAYQKYLTILGNLPAPAPTPEATGVPERQSIELDKFLQRMSHAMLEAQDSLDSASADYLRKTANQPHILPSIFRLPKLSAQMRFALDVGDETKLNLLFYSRDQKTTSRNEQGIDFDVVSVPAPPDAMQAARRLGPVLELVIEPRERNAVMQAVAGFDTDAEPKAKPLVDAATNTPKRILVEAVPVSDQIRRYLLLFAADDDKKTSVGVWLVSIGPDQAVSISTVYELNRKNAPGEEILKTLVAEIASQQDRFLSA